MNASDFLLTTGTRETYSIQVDDALGCLYVSDSSSRDRIVERLHSILEIDLDYGIRASWGREEGHVGVMGGCAD